MFYSVITTNAGNMEIELPADETDWSDADRQQMRKLERFAERVDTYIRRQSYSLLRG